MAQFKQVEKLRQANVKANTPYLSVSARSHGLYKGHSYTFCLPREYAEENLYHEIRQPIMAYFARNEIKWHDGQNGKPSNHLCDSQVSCANFLFPFYDKPAALAALLRPIFPDLQEMLPIEDGQYVAFEWIGQDDYLGERKYRKVKRTRGANYTSPDAAVMFQRVDGHRQIVLIEWKYTETYYSTPFRIAPSGRDRTKIYEHLYLADDCPLSKELIPSFDSLFYEPFYQFMRQQFLAHQMEKAKELGANRVVLLHLSPAQNKAFKRVTSPTLQSIVGSATEVWQQLVKKPDSFIAAHTETVFNQFQIDQFPELSGWWQYIGTRYNWVAY